MRAQAVLCFLWVATPAAEAVAAEPPPVEQFTQEARLDSLTISPSGKLIAATRRDPGGHVLNIAEYPAMQTRISFNYGENLDVADVRFVDDDNLVIQPTRLLRGLRAGKVMAGDILRVDLKAGKSTMLYGTPVAMGGVAYTPQAIRAAANMPAQILTTQSGIPGQILIQTAANPVNKKPGGVYRLDVNTGQAEVAAAEAPLPDARYITGAGRRVALAYATDAQGRTVLFHLPADAKGRNAWVSVVTTRREEGELIPVAWTGEAEKYYALDSRDASTRGVVIWDATTNTQELLYRHPDADITAVAQDPGGKAWMFAGYDDYPMYLYPDPQHPLAVMHQKLVQGLPNTWIEVTGQTDDLSKAIVRVSSATQPPVFLMVDVASATPQVRLDTFPELKAEQMSPVQPFEFKARDGLVIHGYLTTPRDSAGQKLPMIVSVHGGPHGVSDRYDYEYERQLFASRGYAVLQVNYRGSGGRGRDFMLAGFGKWGREMQDDVTDGVRWAVQEGFADPARICIYGGSYGAFSALVGAAREPELFKCAIGYSGIYDLSLMAGSGDIQRQAAGASYLKDAVGGDEAELKARSPVYLARSIRARVMLIHGTDDVRAPIEHAQRMRKALTDAGNPAEWMVAADESHGFSDAGNRGAAYRAMLNFFATSLGRPPEPPGPPLKPPPQAKGPRPEAANRPERSRFPERETAERNPNGDRIPRDSTSILREVYQ